VETLIDRKVYNVKTDLQSTFGTLSDVLNAIPSIDVDADGIVSLRGDGNVLILVDGKPSPQFSGPAAGDNVQSLSATDIERIEVMTTPPAQFKADGAAGVINIITRKTRPKGITGTAQASIGSSGRFNVGTNSSYVSGPLTLALTAGVRHDYRSRLLESDVRAPDPATGIVLDSHSVLDESIHRQVPSVGLSSQYALDERQSISASVHWSERGGLRTYTQRNDGVTQFGAIDSLSQRLSTGHDPEFNHDERLGYTKQLSADGENVEITLLRTTSQQREHYDYTNDSFVPPAATGFSNLNVLEDQATTEFDADYALPLSNSRTLKLGYAFEQDDSRFGNFGANVDPLSGIPVADPAVTHDFEFRQQIDAGYASFQKSTGPWNWLAGLRAELTKTDADQLTDGLSHRGSYFGFYPSVHVDRSLSDVSSLSLGASRRISRPDPSNLDPYIDHEYTPNLRAGNADLQPQTTQSDEFGYGYEKNRLRYQVTGYFRRNRCSVTDVTQYLGNGFSLTTKTNLPRNDAAGVEFTASGDLTRSLAYSVSSNLFHTQIDATALGTPDLRSTNGINGKVKIDFRATVADNTQLIVTRTDKRLTPQGYISAIDIVNVGYKLQASDSA
jgi:outer membrane receptor protein involved in Fe transport